MKAARLSDGSVITEVVSGTGVNKGVAAAMAAMVIGMGVGEPRQVSIIGNPVIMPTIPPNARRRRKRRKAKGARD